MAEATRLRDRWGRDVTLTAARTEHILDRHTDMAPHLSLIANALAEPTLVTWDVADPHAENFYRQIGRRTYLKVCVKYRPSPEGWQGEILTAHLTQRIKRQEQHRWP
jgi:hypothetical protein